MFAHCRSGIYKRMTQDRYTPFALRSKGKQVKMRWVAIAPTSCSQRTAMPIAKAFLTVYSSFYRVGAVAVNTKQMGCKPGKCRQYGGFDSGCPCFADETEVVGCLHRRTRKKFLLWAYPSTLEMVKNNYKKDKCKSQSEFIERAIQYYVGHVTAEDDTSICPMRSFPT